MNRRRVQSGFTIVELLIVVVVIAILATIVIVTYNGIQNRARNSSLQTATTQAFKKITAYAIENNDNYPATLAELGITNGNGTTYAYSVNNSSNPRNFCVSATLDGISYWAARSNTSPTPGTCQVTNLATNPSFESDIAGWGENSGRLAARSTEWSQSGAASLRITNNLSTATNIYARQTTAANCTATAPGDVRSVSATVVSFNVSPTLRARIDWRRADNSLVSSVQTEPAVVAAQGEAVRVYKSGTAPADTVLACAAVHSTGVPAGGILFIDSVMLTDGATQYNYADGNSPGWSWSGTVNNSPSSGPPL